MERRTARAAVRAISNLSKGSSQDLASALLHYDAKPVKIMIKAISSRWTFQKFSDNRGDYKLVTDGRELGKVRPTGPFKP